MAEPPEETPETNEEVEAVAAPDEGSTPAATATTSAATESGTRKERNAAQRRRYRAKQKAKRAEARAAAPVIEEQHAPEHGPGRPKERQGIVVSDKPDKTVIVRVDIARRHKRYHKILRSSITLHVHDESNDANAGDTVRVQECRPMSRTKRWRLLDVLERAK
jgi:small subunit ribosomal protein S17